MDVATSQLFNVARPGIGWLTDNPETGSRSHELAWTTVTVFVNGPGAVEMTPIHNNSEEYEKPVHVSLNHKLWSVCSDIVNI